MTFLTLYLHRGTWPTSQTLPWLVTQSFLLTVLRGRIFDPQVTLVPGEERLRDEPKEPLRGRRLRGTRQVTSVRCEQQDSVDGPARLLQLANAFVIKHSYLSTA